MDSIACLWGIKASFLGYVAKQHGAEVSIGGGTATTTTNEFLFPATVDMPAIGPDGMKFEGDVQFTAHGGMLNVVLADPWIQLDQNQTVLSVITGGYSGSTGTRTVIAELVEREPVDADGSVTYNATLASTGVQVFDGVYAPGEPLDPVRTVRNPPSIHPTMQRAKKN